MAERTASDVMTGPAVTIPEDRPVIEGVDLMLKNKIKRLPVVSENGKLRLYATITVRNEPYDLQ